MLGVGEDVPDKKEKEVDKLTEDLLYIHEDIKEVLDIDSKVTQSVLKRNRGKYPIDELNSLHHQLFLGYIKYMIDEIDKNLAKFKLANVKHFKESLAKPRDTYNHACKVEKPEANEIEAVTDLYETILEIRLKLKETFKELVKEEKDKFRNRFISITGIVVAIYVAAVFGTKTNIAIATAALFYLLLAIIMLYFILKNSVYKIATF